MGSLTTKLTLAGTAADYGAAINLATSKILTVQKPFEGISREVVTTTGANHKILPNVDARRFVYVKHTGVDTTGAATTADLHVETYTDNASGEQAIMVLKTGEFAFFPFDNAIASPDAGGDDNVVQLQASSGTIVAEYSYYTVAS
tara:strand:+ start:873 stop:1307 length:435 start_codon:yes stop_codon:yes gene_type:complete